MNDHPARLPISVIVLTYNEENNIEDCLLSVCDWAGELFVVDSGSTDGTVTTAHRFTSNVVQHPFQNYALQRNWAQSTLPLKNEWILHVDADERVSPELVVSMRRLFRSGQAASVNGAMFSRRTVFMGRWIRHGGHYPVYHTRLFRKDAGGCENRLYDQHFLVEQPVVTLSGDLIDILTSDLDEWSRRHLQWATAEAQEMVRPESERHNQIASRLGGGSITRRRWLRTRLFGRAPLFARAFLYFFYRYFIRRGFLDGLEGLIFHFLHGCWYRFYVDAKIWESEKRLNQR